MRCRLTRDTPAGKSRLKDFPSGIIPKGTVLDSHRAHRMVGLGYAMPEDEECRIAANMSQEQMEQAQAAYPLLAAGIAPEDRDAFRAGAMTGYNPDGSWKEGPKFKEWNSQNEEEDEEEDDE